MKGALLHAVFTIGAIAQWPQLCPKQPTDAYAQVRCPATATCVDAAQGRLEGRSAYGPGGLSRHP